MQPIIEKAVFDWSRSSGKRVQMRGISAILEQKAKEVIIQSQSNSTSRCVWPSLFDNRNSRYLSRRIG